jgi:hypothetical protein
MSAVFAPRLARSGADGTLGAGADGAAAAVPALPSIDAHASAQSPQPHFLMWCLSPG